MNKLLISIILIISVINVLGDEAWEDTPTTTDVWRLVSSGNLESLRQLEAVKPEALTARAADGRNSLFWAYEFEHAHIAGYLLHKGLDTELTDANNNKPRDLLKSDYNTFQNKVETEKLNAQHLPPVTIPTPQSHAPENNNNNNNNIYQFDENAKDDEDDEDDEEEDEEEDEHDEL